MSRVLLASAGFAIVMELVVVPSFKFNYLSTDSRWSMLTFGGALMFLVACANLIYRDDWQWLMYVVVKSHEIYAYIVHLTDAASSPLCKVYSLGVRHHRNARQVCVQQTCISGFAAVDPYWKWDRQTDGRTPYRYIEWPCSAY